MPDPNPFIPTFSIESARSDPADVVERLDTFAVEHGVDEKVRARLAAAASYVVARGQPTLVEADIDQGNLQLVVTRDLGPNELVEQVRMRLADLRDVCDGFAIERRAGTVEIWVCLMLGHARAS